MAAVRLDLPVAIPLRLQSRSGAVHVIAEPRDDVLAEGDKIESRLDEEGLGVRNGRGHNKFTVRCPVGTDVRIGTQSGSVRLDGEFGSVVVTTMSGKIELEAADEADLRSMSGDVVVGRCSGRCRMNAVSGKVTGSDIDAAYANTVSGSIRLGRVAGKMRAHTVSGSIEAGCLGDGPIAVKTVSGKVRIVMPAGLALDARFKTRGQVTCDFPAGDDCSVEAVSLSGAIEVVPG